ncbi:hypothetical protein MKX40_10755 [Paenibacillus sp. FSL R5-0517]|uniref:hypothetical protein n=1 Tax=Paenibacillus sp. FSL R5-0517 TaxID=2921647 RepID=UPI0030DD2BA2
MVLHKGFQCRLISGAINLKRCAMTRTGDGQQFLFGWASFVQPVHHFRWYKRICSIMLSV